MARGDYLGEFELVVMLGVARLDTEASGMTIFEEIHQVTGRDLSIPAGYVTLSRLEKKGYVESTAGDPTVERGGRAKKFYHLTEEGSRALERSQEMLSRLWQGVGLDAAELKP